MAAIPTLQRILIGVLAALIVAIGVVLLTSRASGTTPTAAASSEFVGPTFPAGLRAGDFRLADQNGKPVSLSRYRGKVVILTFIHSLCHDTCPFMVEQIKGALNDLPENGQGVPAIGISVEPGQDTRAHRRKFLAQHEMTNRLAFLNGPLPVMRRIWHAYAIQPVEGPIDHSTFVLLIDKRGFERVGFAADQLTPEGLVHDIRALQREPA